MANKKISQLTAGNPAQTADQIPIARSGANFEVTAASVAALAASTPLYVLQGWPTLPNLSATSIFSSNTGTGDIDLFTVPANKRAVFIMETWNSTASSITSYPEVKIGGSYFAIAVKSTQANTAAAAVQQGNGIILEAGQSFSINTTGTGLNIVGVAYTFDNTAKIKSSAITSFINGDNTVYTYSGSNVAYLIHGATALFQPGAATGSACGGFNNTASTITYKWNFVRSGGSPGTSNQFSASISAAATSGTPVSFGQVSEFAFNPGDFVSVNSSANTAGQLAWVTVVEQ